MEENLKKSSLGKFFGNKFFQEVKVLLYDIRKLWILIIFSVLMLINDSNRSVVLFAVSVVVGVIALAQLSRKLLFPYLDMSQLVEESLKTPISSSVTFASMIYLVSVMINAVIVLLK